MRVRLVPFALSVNLVITFMNTDAVKDIKPLCTCIALLDDSFRRFAGNDVKMEEKWSGSEVSYKGIGNIDT